MRKALVIGIDYYQYGSQLQNCVSDAHAVRDVLERHGNDSVNFSVMTLTGSEPVTAVPRATIREHIRKLFADDSEIALLYFAGHGHVEVESGYILASDSTAGDEGVSLAEILVHANQSRARNKIIVLDSCHSGAAGAAPGSPQTATLSEGMTILTASTSEQLAMEMGGGVFTTLFVDALRGAASNLVGDVTPGSVYAHIDQSLGPWEQRPVFKTNVKSFVSLRNVAPPLPLAELRQIKDLFPHARFEFPLAPSYEPESPDPIDAHTRQFVILQKYNRVNLVVPVGAPHMWHAAMQSKACKLTALGEHYRRLAAEGKI